jgi:hypothetical protein
VGGGELEIMHIKSKQAVHSRAHCGQGLEQESCTVAERDSST